jgi:hypothetical protein
MFFVRVANAGLKVIAFSISCEGSARVASKGFSRRQLTADSWQLRGKRSEGAPDCVLERWPSGWEVGKDGGFNTESTEFTEF